jgi:hypothetical protein
MQPAGETHAAAAGAARAPIVSGAHEQTAKVHGQRGLSDRFGSDKQVRVAQPVQAGGPTE